MKNSIRSSGFTIVEVSLVLAIAGLIFLGVFVALPALQRNTRDTERREDMVALATAIKKYQQNNRGALPSDLGEFSSTSEATASTSWGSFYKNYLGTDFSDPDGGEYILIVSKCTKNGSKCAAQSSDLGVRRVGIIEGAMCDGETVIPSSNPRKVAIIYKLELGAYCGDM